MIIFKLLGLFLLSCMTGFPTLIAKPNSTTTGYISEKSDLIVSGSVTAKTDGQVIELSLIHI